MNTIEAIKRRRVVKLYNPEHEMTEEEISQLMSLAQLTPTLMAMYEIITADRY